MLRSEMKAIKEMPLMFEPLSLNAVVGLPRRGKTAFAILLALQALMKGARIYSNVWIHDGDGNDLRSPEGRLDSEDPGECLTQLLISLGILRKMNPGVSIGF